MVNRQYGGGKLKYVPKFYIGGTGYVISRMRNDDLHWSCRHFGAEYPEHGWRYTLGHNGGRIGNGVWEVEWSHDR